MFLWKPKKVATLHVVFQPSCNWGASTLFRCVTKNTTKVLWAYIYLLVAPPQKGTCSEDMVSWIALMWKRNNISFISLEWEICLPARLARTLNFHAPLLLWYLTRGTSAHAYQKSRKFASIRKCLESEGLHSHTKHLKIPGTLVVVQVHIPSSQVSDRNMTQARPNTAFLWSWASCISGSKAMNHWLCLSPVAMVVDGEHQSGY